MRVVAIGLRYDKVAAGVRALLDAGAQVVTFDLGDLYDENPLQDEVKEELVRCESHGERFQLSSYGPRGSTWRDVLRDDGPGPLIEEAVRQGGGLDAVYVGTWWGFPDYGVGQKLLEAIDAAGAGELVFTEEIGQRVARMAFAIAPSATSVRVDVVREFRSDQKGPPPRGAGRMAAVLCRAGWRRLTPKALEDEATALRASGEDLLAGADWAGAASGSAFNVGVAPVEILGAGLTTISARALPGRGVLRRPRIVVFEGSSPDWYYVEVTSENDCVVGVRIGWEIDSFDEGRPTGISEPSILPAAGSPSVRARAWRRVKSPLWYSTLLPASGPRRMRAHRTQRATACDGRGPRLEPENHSCFCLRRSASCGRSR